MTAWIFFLLALAGWRLSSMVVNEAGPWHFFTWLRSRTGIQHDGDDPTIIPNRFFSNLLSCVWCFSMWTSLVWLICWFFFPEITIYFAMPFALSALIILLDKLISK